MISYVSLLYLLLTLIHSVYSLCHNDSYTEKKRVQFGLMTAADNRLRFVSVGCIPAIDLAVDMINSNDDLLKGYYLSHNDYIDTGCERRSAYNSFFDFVESDLPPSIAILGAGCSTASEPVAELAPFWNTPIMAYVSASPLLSNRVRYPNFYRTYISDALIAPAFVQLVKSFGWKRILIITENEPVFAGNIREQIDLLEVDGVEVKTFMFETNEFNPDRLGSELDEDDHVFFINTFEDAARDILCYFHRVGKHYPAYAFITHAWFQEEWYLKDTTKFCKPVEVERQLDRTITFIPFIVNKNRNEQTYSGLNVPEFDRMYRERLDQASLIYQPEGYTAFDGVYSLAIAMDTVQRAVCDGDNMGCTFSPNLTSIEDFQYHDSQLECMMKTALSRTNFTGISGPVMFDENGTRIIYDFEIKQYQMDSNECNMTSCHVTVGVANGIQGTFEFLYNNSNATVWPAGVPPDGTPIVTVNTLPLPLIIVMDIVVVVGIAFAILCLMFNIVFRNKRIIKLSSPTLNYIIIIGALFSYSSVLFTMLPGTDIHSLSCRCNVAHVFALFGYTLSFTAILAKMWRVYYIFHNPTTKKRSIRDWHLLIIVSILTSIMLFMLILSDAVSFFRRVPELVADDETSNIRNNLDVSVKYMIYACSSSTQALVAAGIVFSYAFVLQLVGIILAFQTRKVKIKGLNDAKQVIAIIYINTICLLIFTLTSTALGNLLITTSVLFSLSITAAATVFLTFLFIPKMISLYRDPEGKGVFSSGTQTGTAAGGTGGPSSNGNGSTPSSSVTPGRRSIVTLAVTAAGIDDTKVIIQKLENRVSELKEEIEQYDEPAVPDVALRKKVSILSLKDKFLGSL